MLNYNRGDNKSLTPLGSIFMTSSPLPMTTPEDIGLSSSALARLGKVLSGEVATGRLPGAVALIARRGRVAWFESFGQRDPANGAPMARDAIFRIYSMTKPIVSVAAMLLWEEGRFLSSDPIGKYLPIGSLSRKLPSSYNIIAATETIGLVIE